MFKLTIFYFVILFLLPLLTLNLYDGDDEDPQPLDNTSLPLPNFATTTETETYSSCPYITTYCDLYNACDWNPRICPFCSPRNDDLPSLTIYYGDSDSTCDSIFQVRCEEFEKEKKGAFRALLMYTEILSITNLVFADDLYVKGFNIFDNRYLIQSISLLNNKAPVKSSINELKIFAGYDNLCKNLYYVLNNNTLWFSSENPRNMLENATYLRTFESIITLANIDFTDRKNPIIYYAIFREKNIEIYKDNLYQVATSAAILVASIPFGDSASTFSAMTYDEKSKLLYISVASKIYMVKKNSVVDDIIPYCDVKCEVFSFTLNLDLLYYSCIDVGAIRYIDAHSCRGDNLTYDVLPKPPLIIRTSDTQNQQGTPDFCRTAESTHFPFWFPYAVAAGSALLLIAFIGIIICCCCVCRRRDRTIVAPPLPPGFTGLRYEDKLNEENLYTDLEIFETTPKIKKKKVPTATLR